MLSPDNWTQLWNCKSVKYSISVYIQSAPNPAHLGTDEKAAVLGGIGSNI